jgi:hypothetical protein
LQFAKNSPERGKICNLQKTPPKGEKFAICKKEFLFDAKIPPTSFSLP